VGITEKQIRKTLVKSVQEGLLIPMTILTIIIIIIKMIVKSVHLVNIKTRKAEVLAKTALKVHQDQYMEMMAIHGMVHLRIDT
jgi:hypothetical protein